MKINGIFDGQNERSRHLPPESITASQRTRSRFRLLACPSHFFGCGGVNSSSGIASGNSHVASSHSSLTSLFHLQRILVGKLSPATPGLCTPISHERRTGNPCSGI